MTIIYSHGNATDCGAMFIMYAMLALTLKVNVVGYDYTGYGSSYDSGVPTTEKQTYKGTLKSPSISSNFFSTTLIIFNDLHHSLI